MISQKNIIFYTQVPIINNTKWELIEGFPQSGLASAGCYVNSDRKVVLVGGMMQLSKFFLNLYIVKKISFRKGVNGTMNATKNIQIIPIEHLKNSTDVKDKVKLETNGLSKPLANPYVGQICKFQNTI